MQRWICVLVLIAGCESDDEERRAAERSKRTDRQIAEEKMEEELMAELEAIEDRRRELEAKLETATPEERKRIEAELEEIRATVE